jgi:hypothetical protein
LIYTREPITPLRLAQVWGNLWPRGKQEFAALGISLDSAFHLFLDYASRATDSGIVCADSVPFLVAGTCPDGDSSFTFMQATVGFVHHYKEGMRQMRRATKAHVGPLFIYSVLIHPKAARFFEAMGYERDEWTSKTENGATLYRFKRK